MIPTQFWSQSLNLTMIFWNFWKYRIFSFEKNSPSRFHEILKILYFWKFQNIIVKFKLGDQNWVGIMSHMFSFGQNTKFMTKVSWFQLIVLGFQNNSFLLKVAYNQVYKWPLFCFWHFCCFHPFLAKILFYVLRAQKTKKSYLRNGAL